LLEWKYKPDNVIKENEKLAKWLISAWTSSKLSKDLLEKDFKQSWVFLWRISKLNKDNFVYAWRYSPGSKAKMYTQVPETEISWRGSVSSIPWFRSIIDN
jgi:hypothetical protein